MVWGLLFDFHILDPVLQDRVDQFVTGTVGFGSKPIQISQNILTDSDGDNTVSVIASTLDF